MKNAGSNWPADDDHSFMGHWYPEPSEFMPCRSAQHTPTWGRHDMLRMGRAMHIAHACLRQRCGRAFADEHSRPPHIHKPLVLVCPRCEYKDVSTVHT